MKRLRLGLGILKILKIDFSTILRSRRKGGCASLNLFRRFQILKINFKKGMASGRCNWKREKGRQAADEFCSCSSRCKLVLLQSWLVARTSIARVTAPIIGLLGSEVCPPADEVSESAHLLDS